MTMTMTDAPMKVARTPQVRTARQWLQDPDNQLRLATVALLLGCWIVIGWDGLRSAWRFDAFEQLHWRAVWQQWLSRDRPLPPRLLGSLLAWLMGIPIITWFAFRIDPALFLLPLTRLRRGRRREHPLNTASEPPASAPREVTGPADAPKTPAKGPPGALRDTATPGRPYQQQPSPSAAGKGAGAPQQPDAPLRPPKADQDETFSRKAPSGDLTIEGAGAAAPKAPNTALATAQARQAASQGDDRTAADVIAPAESTQAESTSAEFVTGSATADAYAPWKAETPLKSDPTWPPPALTLEEKRRLAQIASQAEARGYVAVQQIPLEGGAAPLLLVSTRNVLVIWIASTPGLWNAPERVGGSELPAWLDVETSEEWDPSPVATAMAIEAHLIAMHGAALEAAGVASQPVLVLTTATIENVDDAQLAWKDMGVSVVRMDTASALLPHLDVLLDECRPDLDAAIDDELVALLEGS